jgi:hypothetical protein
VTCEYGQVDLAAAIRALRRAEEDLPRAEQRAEERAREIKAAARAKVDRARAALHEAMVAKYEAGEARQIDLIRETGYSRERVRQILRAGGVEPE